MFLEISQASACNFIKKEALAQVFSCELCEISDSDKIYLILSGICLWNQCGVSVESSGNQCGLSVESSGNHYIFKVTAFSKC